MTDNIFQVKNYEIVLGSELSGGGGGESFRGYVVCRGSGDEWLIIYFINPGSAGGPPVTSADGKRGSFCAPFSEMQKYTDLLRNEKPIYAHMFTDEPKFNYLSTVKEPVGETEGKAN